MTNRLSSQQLIREAVREYINSHPDCGYGYMMIGDGSWGSSDILLVDVQGSQEEGNLSRWHMVEPTIEDRVAQERDWDDHQYELVKNAIGEGQYENGEIGCPPIVYRARQEV